MDDETTRAHDIACAASSIVWGGELGWVSGDHKALIAKLHRLKVDSDNLRFLHEEVYPMLGWDGGETPPLTFLEELITEVKSLRATAEVVERAGKAISHSPWPKVEYDVLEHVFLANPGDGPGGRDEYPTLLEALEALAGEGGDGSGLAAKVVASLRATP